MRSTAPQLSVIPRSTLVLPTALLTLLLLLMSGGVAGAVSYQRTDGSISTVGNLVCCGFPSQVSHYVSFIGPGLGYSQAQLGFVSAPYADLRNSDLTNANLSNSDFSGGDFRGAKMLGTILSNTDLTNVDLRGASLVSAKWLASVVGLPIYDSQTDFGSGVNAAYSFQGREAFSCFGYETTECKRFDPVAAGWTLVPEPSSSLLISLGLIGMSLRRRTTSKSL